MERSQTGKEMGPSVVERHIEIKRKTRTGSQGPGNFKPSPGGKAVVEVDERRKGYMETNMDSKI